VKGLIVILFFFFVNQTVFAQKIEIEEVLIAKDSVVYKAIDPLAPSKSCFLFCYSSRIRSSLQ